MLSTSFSDDSKNNSNIDWDQVGMIFQLKKKSDNSIAPITNHYDDFFENFMQNMQNMQNISNTMEQTWPNSIFPTIKIFFPFEWFDKWTDTRLPLFDVIDKGDKYEITLRYLVLIRIKLMLKQQKIL